jgi:hypothetical protein
MNESAPITGFQVEVANVFFAMPEASSFLLAGGLALLAQGMSVRPTEDMDAFTSNPDDVQRASAAFQVAARSRGWGVEVVRASETFVRLQVEGSEQILVDLALDSPPGLPSMMSILGPTYAPDELAARKLLALFGRALPRDFVDVYRVTSSRSESELFELARSIDPGLEEGRLVLAMGQLARYSDSQLDIEPEEIDAMRAYFDEWTRRLAERK